VSVTNLGVLQVKKCSGILVHPTQLNAPLQIQRRVESLIAHVLNSDQAAIFVLLSTICFHFWQKREIIVLYRILMVDKSDAFI
jgi:hypothetical protein